MCIRDKGLTVRGLKCGPDYIDPAFHAAATGAPSANLDSYAMTDGLLGRIAGEAADAADIVIAEGSMGLFDAVPGEVGHTAVSYTHLEYREPDQPGAGQAQQLRSFRQG